MATVTPPVTRVTRLVEKARTNVTRVTRRVTSGVNQAGRWLKRRDWPDQIERLGCAGITLAIGGLAGFWWGVLAGSIALNYLAWGAEK